MRSAACQPRKELVVTGGAEPLTTAFQARESAPAETFQINDGPDCVGIIGSVTRPFCGTCGRVRLTADGLVGDSLFAATETDLRAALRPGASDGQLAGLWRTAP